MSGQRRKKSKTSRCLKTMSPRLIKFFAGIRDVEKAKPSWEKAAGDVSTADAAYKKAVEAQKIEEQKVIGTKRLRCSPC